MHEIGGCLFHRAIILGSFERTFLSMLSLSNARQKENEFVDTLDVAVVISDELCEFCSIVPSTLDSTTVLNILYF